MQLGKTKYKGFQLVKQYCCKQGWQGDGGGFKKCDILSAIRNLKIYWKNVYYSKPGVRNHTP